jgi:2-polyprenyl-3-methyl-5-hydroxy-6-metoxy-1,4-benzoquinol methylase
MESKKHWENVYTSKVYSEVSWFQQHAQLSLKLIRNANFPSTASIIDVGGGASTLVDDLLKSGFQQITILDLSEAALTTAKTRIGAHAADVKWVNSDILTVDLPTHEYDIWHDRAVFHFLTTAEERHTYVQKMLQAIKSDGFVIIATFAEDGPTQCSGLPVSRYSAKGLNSVFGEYFELLGHKKETHHTPGGNEQKFTYCFFRKKHNRL